MDKVHDDDDDDGSHTLSRRESRCDTHRHGNGGDSHVAAEERKVVHHVLVGPLEELGGHAEFQGRESRVANRQKVNAGLERCGLVWPYECSKCVATDV